MDKISIVLPVCNVEMYLRECLDSILAQTYTNFEVICVNDGSEDSSLDILLEYKVKDRRVRIINQENSGLSIARNVGIKNATGDYICFVDSDDTLVLDALEILKHTIEKERYQIITYENNVIYESYEMFQKENKDAYYTVNNNYSHINNGRRLFCEKMNNNDFVESAWLMLISRKWLVSQDIEFEPYAFFEDSIFSLECYFACDSIKHINKKLYNYRVRENSIMTKKFTYKHAYYRLWQIRECFRIFFSYAKNDSEKIAISKYALQCVVSARYAFSKLDLSDRDRILQLSSVEGLFVAMMGFQNICYCNYNSLELLGFEELVKRYNRIILYGAGVIGNKVLCWLDERGLQDRVIGFAVSHKELVHNEKKIKFIGDYSVESGLLVVISASETFHK